MTEDIKAKFEELIGNEEFRAQLKGLKDRTSIRNLFASNGLELSDDILDAAEKEIKRLENSGELDENTLDFVSGGWSWKACGTGLVAGALFGATQGGVYGAIAGGVIGAVAFGIIG